MSQSRIELLKEYIKKEPDEPFNKHALAMEYLSLDELKKALELFENLHINHSDYLPTYFQYAHLLWDLEELRKAKMLFEEGIELAKEQGNHKTLNELNAAFTNFEMEYDESD